MTLSRHLLVVLALLSLIGCGKESEGKRFPLTVPYTPQVRPTWEDQEAADSCPSGTVYACPNMQKCQCFTPAQYTASFPNG